MSLPPSISGVSACVGTVRMECDRLDHSFTPDEARQVAAELLAASVIADEKASRCALNGGAR